jgi:hypothetical protein
VVAVEPRRIVIELSREQFEALERPKRPARTGRLRSGRRRSAAETAERVQAVKGPSPDEVMLAVPSRPGRGAASTSQSSSYGIFRRRFSVGTCSPPWQRLASCRICPYPTRSSSPS